MATPDGPSSARLGGGSLERAQGFTSLVVQAILGEDQGISLTLYQGFQKRQSLERALVDRKLFNNQMLGQGPVPTHRLPGAGPPADRASLPGSLCSGTFEVLVCSYVVLNHGRSSRPASQSSVAELGYLHRLGYLCREQQKGKLPIVSAHCRNIELG